jgi:excisionase family DNA binding protein
MSDEVLTKEQLAKLLNVSERTVERWVEERTVPFVILPQRGSRCNVRFLKPTILSWLCRREKKASNKLVKEVESAEEN